MWPLRLECVQGECLQHGARDGVPFFCHLVPLQQKRCSHVKGKIQKNKNINMNKNRYGQKIKMKKKNNKEKDKKRLKTKKKRSEK